MRSKPRSSSRTRGEESVPFLLGEETLDITIKRRSRQKYIRLRISGRGEVVVSAPRSTSKNEIKKALAKKKSWIEGHLKRIRHGLEEADPLKRIYFSGTVYPVDIRDGEGTRFSVRLSSKNETLIVRVPKTFRPGSEGERTARIEEAIAGWLRRKASETMRERAEEISGDIDMPFKKLYIRNQRTRWGSSSSLGNISINWRAVMAPPEVQRYLIIHELAHQKHLNHSDHFWREVQRHCPDFRTHEQWLKRHQTLMSLFR